MNASVNDSVNKSWDHSVDVLVVGSGNGALTTALCAHELGAGEVLVIEKSAKYGGTSSISGGGVWIACNRYAKAAGAKDSIEDVREYLRLALPPGAVPDELLDTYVAEGPKMIDFLHERTRVRYRNLPHYPDYYNHLKGSRSGDRSMEPEPVMRSDLGAEADRLLDAHDMMWLFGRVAFTQEEAQILWSMPPGWKKLAWNLVWQHVKDVGWWLRNKRSRRLTNGGAGVARLRLSMLDRKMPLWLETPFQELVVDDSGRVVGVVATRNGKTIRIQARRGVMLAAGGFEHNQKMREQYLPKPTNTEWSAGYKYNTGDAIRAGLSLGAATRLMNGAWWCTTLPVPDAPVPWLSIIEKSLPGNCVVNQRGERITNESQNYMAYLLELFRKHTPEHPQDPSWMIFDARFRRSYLVGPLMNSRFKPDWMLPQSFFTSGFLTKSNTIADLAQRIGIDSNALEKTVQKMNDYASTGKDTEFGRGDSIYDRYYGDPTIKPNPCLAPIAEAPFYAMRIEPGDFGTHGGLSINTNAQVLRTDGTPIPGLYATGNTAGAILPTYPGPGSTLGPAMTFGYQAAKHMAGKSTG